MTRTRVLAHHLALLKRIATAGLVTTNGAPDKPVFRLMTPLGAVKETLSAPAVTRLIEDGLVELVPLPGNDARIYRVTTEGILLTMACPDPVIENPAHRLVPEMWWGRRCDDGQVILGPLGAVELVRITRLAILLRQRGRFVDVDHASLSVEARIVDAPLLPASLQEGPERLVWLSTRELLPWGPQDARLLLSYHPDENGVYLNAQRSADSPLEEVAAWHDTFLSWLEGETPVLADPAMSAAVKRVDWLL